MKNSRKGFTLTECIITVTILGIIAAVGVGGYTRLQTKQQLRNATVNARAVESKLTIFLAKKNVPSFLLTRSQGGLSQIEIEDLNQHFDLSLSDNYFQYYITVCDSNPALAGIQPGSSYRILAKKGSGSSAQYVVLSDAGSTYGTGTGYNSYTQCSID